MARKTPGFRGYTPLPAHLAHLGVDVSRAKKAEIGPLDGGSSVYAQGAWYHEGYRPPRPASLGWYVLGREGPEGIHEVRSYTFREHLAEAIAMLRAGATEDEIIGYEHTS